MDDFAATTGTTGTVPVGGSATGEIETTGDADWFKITLQAGVTYRFDLEGSDTGQGTLQAPLLELRDGSGNSLLSDSTGGGFGGPGPGYSSRITYTAAGSGSFFLASDPLGNEIGTYRLSAAIVSTSLVDDFAATTATTGTVPVGGSATGEIETTGDADWFKITLQAGVTYRFDLEGSDTGQGTLQAPLLELRDGSGNSLLSDSTGGGFGGPGPGYSSRITYTAAGSGSFFLASDPLGNEIGTYRLSASVVSPQQLLGSTANDALTGGADNDFIFGGSFAANGSFLPNSGNDTLEGGGGNDGLWGADGDDILSGGLGNDGLVGGAGNDVLNGQDGTDWLFGGDFSVVDGSFVPNSGDDTLNGGNGNDGLWGFDGNDLINGDAGDDYTEGGLGNDLISGGADNDTLVSQAGADTVGGGAGFDYLYGGAGPDVFVFNRGDSFDTVWDFSAAEGDKIRLDPALGIATLADLQSHLSGFTFGGADYTVISFPNSVDQLTIKGVASTAFTLALLEG